MAQSDLKSGILYWLGLDISKEKIDCCIHIQSKYKHIIISNDENGFMQLLEWLCSLKIDTQSLHVCCEATNVYYIAIAQYLYRHQIAISVINPSIIKHYAQYHLKRIKTDKQDAKLIAQYAKAETPELWQPESECKAELKSLHRRCEQLNNMLTMEKNRLYVADGYSKTMIEKIINTLQIQLEECRKRMQRLIDKNADLKRKQQILKSITGLGETTSQILLAVLIDIDKFTTAKHLISWLGLSPVIRQSGKYKGQAKLSKMGDRSVRKSLYIPARVACTRSKLWRSWFDKQVQSKPPKKVYVMMMVKLVKYAYHCIKNDTLFNPSLHEQPTKENQAA
ncbi:IS110 family transposase [Neisseriaceae bacterium B1]